MSAKAQRELIKGGPPRPVTKRGKPENASKTGIPANDHTERDKVLDKLKGKK